MKNRISQRRKQTGMRPVSQKVKIDDSGNQKKQGLSSGPKLQRTTFRTSRDMDFFNQKELVTQTGHDAIEWPLVFLKELLDNGLDACEGAGIPPRIDVVADQCGITVTDNGPGLPEETLRAQLDFSVRASNREAYVAPDRGAQGNALKTLLAMPRVVDPDHGRLIVEAGGKRHVLTCTADPVSQRAEVNDDESPSTAAGTSVRMEWSPLHAYDSSFDWPFERLNPYDQIDYEAKFPEMLQGFALFNPHVHFTLDWFGTRRQWCATAPDWCKWTADKPTSPHWYEVEHFKRLIGAYVTDDRDRGEDRLVGDLVAEFDGLSGSRKRTQVLSATDLKRTRLSELIHDGDFDHERIAALLEAMKANSRTVRPQRLGIIGEAHLRQRFLEMGVQPDSFQYSKKLGKEALPWVLESAFGYLADDPKANRQIFAGANWSAAIKNPFRSFGDTGEGLEAALTDMRAGRREPIVFCLHLAHPRVQYTDRGKSALVMGGGNEE